MSEFPKNIPTFHVEACESFGKFLQEIPEEDEKPFLNADQSRFKIIKGKGTFLVFVQIFSKNEGGNWFLRFLLFSTLLLPTLPWPHPPYQKIYTHLN